jgi:hypothetical protein
MSEVERIEELNLFDFPGQQITFLVCGTNFERRDFDDCQEEINFGDHKKVAAIRKLITSCGGKLCQRVTEDPFFCISPQKKGVETNSAWIKLSWLNKCITKKCFLLPTNEDFYSQQSTELYGPKLQSISEHHISITFNKKKISFSLDQVSAILEEIHDKKASGS